MVRKSVRMLTIFCLLAAILAQPIAASAASYNAYDSNISSTYVTIFRDIVGKVPINQDYVFFRAGQYEYLLVSGDMEYSGGVFFAPVCTEYRIITETGYNSSYSFFQTEETDFVLDPGNGLVYSNFLGSFLVFESTQVHIKVSGPYI